MREFQSTDIEAGKTRSEIVNQLSFLSRLQKYSPLKQIIKGMALVGFGVLSYLGLNYAFRSSSRDEKLSSDRVKADNSGLVIADRQTELALPIDTGSILLAKTSKIDLSRDLMSPQRRNLFSVELKNKEDQEDALDIVYRTSSRTRNISAFESDSGIANKGGSGDYDEEKIYQTEAIDTTYNKDHVLQTNNAPEITAGSTLGYNEGDNPTVIDNTIAVTDVDDTNIESATVTISVGYQDGEDVLAFINQSGIIGSWSNATGVLTLSGTATIGQYQAALRSVTYQNTSENPSTASRTMSFIINDGALDSDPAISTVNVAAVNNKPEITAGSTLGYSEGDGLKVIDNTITVADVDDTNIESATIIISTGYQNGEDVLAFINQSGITGSWNATTGVLTLSGTATIGQYQAALRSVTYQNTSENPSTASRTMSFVVNDGESDSLAATSTVNVATIVATPEESPEEPPDPTVPIVVSSTTLTAAAIAAYFVIRRVRNKRRERIQKSSADMEIPLEEGVNECPQRKINPGSPCFFQLSDDGKTKSVDVAAGQKVVTAEAKGLNRV